MPGKLPDRQYHRLMDQYDSELPEEERPIGKWGRMHRAIFTYLAGLNKQAQDRYWCIVRQMMEAGGVTYEYPTPPRIDNPISVRYNKMRS